MIRAQSTASTVSSRSPDLAFDLAATILGLWLPLLIFLRHHDYTLWKPEILACLGLSVLAGMLAGLVMYFGRSVGRVVVSVLVLVLITDVQTDWITTWGLRLLLCVVVFGFPCWLLRRRLSRILTLIFGATVLATLLLPAQPSLQRDGDMTAPDPTRDNLPFILHLVMDEHIGIEGIPREFDPDGGIAARIRDDYLADDFTVFGRAYSHYYLTNQSLANMLNFTSLDDPQHYFDGRFVEGMRPRENAYFDYLRQRGYRLHVVQSDYMHFLDPMRENGTGSSLTYASETISSLEGVDIPASEKVQFILGSYARLSFFLTRHKLWYRSLRSCSLGRNLGLPAWDLSGDRLSSVATMTLLEAVGEDLRHAGPGRAYFIHLLLPHYPYSYRADCTVRPRASQWLDADHAAIAPRRNDTDSRAARYPMYLEQLVCTHTRVREMFDLLRESGVWENTIVIVQGDHGSRIDRGPPNFAQAEYMEPLDYVDGFSTLFAVKMPDRPGGYDRRLLPLDHLLAETWGFATPEAGRPLEAEPTVFLSSHVETMPRRPLPSFEHGTIPVR